MKTFLYCISLPKRSGNRTQIERLHRSIIMHDLAGDCVIFIALSLITFLIATA